MTPTVFSHQEGLTCAAKVAAAFPGQTVSLSLRPRQTRPYQELGPHADVSLTLGEDDRDIDGIVRVREKIRQLGYEAEADGSTYQLDVLKP